MTSCKLCGCSQLIRSNYRVCGWEISQWPIQCQWWQMTHWLWVVITGMKPWAVRSNHPPNLHPRMLEAALANSLTGGLSWLSLSSESLVLDFWRFGLLLSPIYPELFSCNFSTSWAVSIQSSMLLKPEGIFSLLMTSLYRKNVHHYQLFWQVPESRSRSCPWLGGGLQKTVDAGYFTTLISASSLVFTSMGINLPLG